jgi:hypothetical protein
LVQGTSTLETMGSEASAADSGVRQIPIPDLRAGDPVFTFIWETSDLSEFRHRVVITVAEDLDCSGIPVCSEEICTYDEGFIAGLLLAYSG